VRQQEPVLTAFPQSPAALAIRALSGPLWDEVPPTPRVEPDPEAQRLEA
jgi:hypothetical protein